MVIFHSLFPAWASQTVCSEWVYSLNHLTSDVPGVVWEEAQTVSLLSSVFCSWCAVESSGRHSNNENKEMGRGPGEDGAVACSVHLSLPQAWCQWTTGERWVCLLACPSTKIGLENLLQLYQVITYNCVCFFPFSLSTLTSHFLLHRIKKWGSSLMWVNKMVTMIVWIKQ